MQHALAVLAACQARSVQAAATASPRPTAPLRACPTAPRRDALFLGDCDDGVRQLCQLLGWEAELDALLADSRAHFHPAAGAGSEAGQGGDAALKAAAAAAPAGAAPLTTAAAVAGLTEAAAEGAEG